MDVLDAPDVDDPTGFGASLAADGNWLVVGSPYDGPGNGGRAYVFENIDGAWLLRQVLVPDGLLGNSELGWSVAIHGDLIAVSAPSGTRGSQRGQVYLFERINGTWTEIQTLDSASETVTRFGQSLSLSAKGLLVGEYFSAPVGQVHVYERPVDTFQLVQTIDGPALIEEAVGFGFAVAWAGNQFLVGNPFLFNDNNGRVTVFERVSVDYEIVQTIDGVGGFENLGVSLSVAGDLAVAGTEASLVNILTRSAGVWSEERLDLSGAGFTTDAPNLDFSGGMAVSVAADRILVGAPFSVIGGDSQPSGAVKVVTRSAMVWSESSYEAGAEEGDNFGYAVLQHPTGDLIGARFGDADTGEDQGFVQLGLAAVKGPVDRLAEASGPRPAQGFPQTLARTPSLVVSSAPFARTIRDGVRTFTGLGFVFGDGAPLPLRPGPGQLNLGFVTATAADDDLVMIDATVSSLADRLNVYRRDGNEFVLQQELDPSGSRIVQAEASGNVLVVATDAGIEAYRRSGDEWTFPNTIVPTAADFGTVPVSADDLSIVAIDLANCSLTEGVGLFQFIAVAWIELFAAPGRRDSDGEILCATSVHFEGLRLLVGYTPDPAGPVPELVLYEVVDGAFVERQVIPNASPFGARLSGDLIVANTLDTRRPAVWRLVNGRFSQAEALAFDEAFVRRLAAAGDAAAVSAGTTISLYDLTESELQAVPSPFGISPGDRFGAAVDTDGNLFVAGRPGARDGQGDVLVYRVEGGALILDAQLTVPPGRSAAEFGASLALDGDQLIVGAPGTPPAVRGGVTAMQAALYQRLDSGWQLKADFQSPGANDGFGTSVALDGSLLAIGAPEDAEGGEDAGAAYLFRFDGENTVASTKLMSSEPAAGGRFGSAVGVLKDGVAVGAPGTIGGAVQGSVSLYDQVTENLSGLAVAGIIQGDSGGPGDGYGSAVAIDGRAMAIGAPGEDGSGAVYVYDPEGRSQQARLAPDGLPLDARFGSAVATAGGQFAVGAPGTAGGSVFRFTSLGAEATVLEGQSGGDGFGSAIGLGDGGLIAGAPQTLDDVGAAFIVRDTDRLFSGGFE